MEEERRPHFFKVLVGDFARRLEIPQDFLGHIPEVELRTSDTSVASSAKVTLKHPEGKTWVVQLEKVDGCVFLTTGWPKFVEDSSLMEYEFLLFRYDKDMHFMVLVFGRNACEKAIWSSGSGAQATGSIEGKLPCDIFPSSGDKLTETANSLTHSHSQLVTLQRSTQGDEHISSQGFPDLHEVHGSKDELETYLSSKGPMEDEGPMEDDKTKAIAKVMKILHVDKATTDLFCATLSLYKWNADAAAEDFDVCRGKPQIQSQFLKQKLVLQFDFVKRQLRRFFPPDDDCSATIPDSRNSSLEEPNLSKPLQCDLTAVKRRLVDEYELCDLSHKQKRRIGKLRRGSLRTPETPRRSPRRLARLKNSLDSTKNVLKERAEVIESSPASTIDQVEDRAEQACLLYKKADNVLEGVHEQMIGSLSQDLKRFKPACGEGGLSEGPQHNHGDNEQKLDQGNNVETSEQMERNAAETSESFMRKGCIESLPTNSKVPSSSIINELCFTWKPSEHANPLEKILLDIQRDNFSKTISHVQGIIWNRPSDLLTAAVIDAVLQKEILKWDLCLEDRDAQRIVNALLEHAKKIKEMHNFNMETRKEEFSAKLQDQLKWQLKELESAYTSLELDYKKATSDANIAVSTLQEQKKKLQALQDDIKDLQQSLMMKEDEMQKLKHQVAEHESVVQKSLMERVRIKTVLKSYEQILEEVKDRLASTELGSIDVDALVKVEMDNMSREIELSKGSLLNINFK